ncbi:MAG: ATP-binding protein [Betaproteobacteria bacterium]|nr:ATP-binding protein [Betaproteobacteria bacterium]
MFTRKKLLELEQTLQRSPAVVLLGPRQVGKTTLALQVAEPDGAYLDLESPEDRNKLDNVEQYLRTRQERLVVLDEVQRLPTLFEPLRGLIDQARRTGSANGTRTNGFYLLLGSASLDLIQHSSETLAGRIAFVELSGLHRLEVPPELWDALWVRGGFPPSLTALSEADSLLWRRDFTRTYLERDVAQFAPRTSAELLRRFWTMLAHLQGSTLNMAQLARNLGIDTRTANGYLDLLTDLLLTRKLAPWSTNRGKRLVKSHKVYIRDSGLLHSLLGITNMDALLSHPIVGASWEGHVIESLLAVAPAGTQPSFYRSNAGAEIDLLLTWPNGEHWAIEIKRSTTPKVERGFYSACEDIQPTHKLLIYPGHESYPLGDGIEVMPLHAAMQALDSA